MTKVKAKQEKKKSEIIEAILPMLGDIPFEEISMADICEAADISTGSFYHYFKRKSDILVGLLGIIDEYMEEYAFPKMTKRDEISNLKVFATEWLKYVEAHGLERSKLISSVGATDYTQTGEKRISFIKLEEHIQKGQNKGQIKNDLSATKYAEMFLVALRGLTIDWTRRNAAYSLQDEGQEYIQFLLSGMQA